MNYLVTGGAGFIGGALSRHLLQEGHDVIVLDNFATSQPMDVPTGALLIKGDILDENVLAKAFRNVDVVFHQAALRSVPRSIDEPLAVAQTNIQGTINVLEAARKQHVRRVVYASSSSVYGDNTTVPQKEFLTPYPISPYAVSKLSGEHFCRTWSKVFGTSTISLRYFNVYGPGQKLDSKYATIFPAFIKSLLNGKRPTIHWDGEQARDFTYIDDVVSANIMAASASEEISGEVFNVAAGRSRTVNEVFQTVRQLLQSTLEPHYVEKRAGDVRATHADISSAFRSLGWRPTAKWEDSIQDTIEWLGRIGT